MYHNVSYCPSAPNRERTGADRDRSPIALIEDSTSAALADKWRTNGLTPLVCKISLLKVRCLTIRVLSPVQ